MSGSVHSGSIHMYEKPAARILDIQITKDGSNMPGKRFVKIHSQQVNRLQLV